MVCDVPVISPQIAAEFARRSHADNARASRPSSLRTINELQDKLAKLALSDSVDAREAAQAACAWDKLEARRAILLGKPANTSQAIKQVDKTRARKRLSGPVEYLPESPSIEPSPKPGDAA